MQPDRALFCLGMGYSARKLAGLLGAEGWRVSGTCRTPDPSRPGLHAFDGSAPLGPAGLDALRQATHLLMSIPPDGDGDMPDPVLRWHAGDLAALPGLRWIGYLSTTGVYGDRRGAWVTEESPCLPVSARGRWRVAAEQAWLDLHRHHALPVHVFRLAGIYGPGRNALTAVRAGTARRIRKPGQVFGRIHVDDIVCVLRASADRPMPGRIYNVCDDEPAPPDRVILEACTLLAAPPPVVESFPVPGMSAMARSFYADSKRVSNRRVTTELGITLRWPNYRAGLRGLLAAGE